MVRTTCTQSPSDPRAWWPTLGDHYTRSSWRTASGCLLLVRGLPSLSFLDFPGLGRAHTLSAPQAPTGAPFVPECHECLVGTLTDPCHPLRPPPLIFHRRGLAVAPAPAFQLPCSHLLQPPDPTAARPAPGPGLTSLPMSSSWASSVDPHRCDFSF